MDDETAAAIASNIRRLRKQARMSQELLSAQMREAGQAHWHQNTVSRVEASRQRVTLEEIRCLNDILGGNVMDNVFPKATADFYDSYFDMVDVTLAAVLKDTEAIRERVERVRRAAAELRFTDGLRQSEHRLEVTTRDASGWHYSDGTTRQRLKLEEGDDGERQEAP